MIKRFAALAMAIMLLCTCTLAEETPVPEPLAIEKVTETLTAAPAAAGESDGQESGTDAGYTPEPTIIADKTPDATVVPVNTAVPEVTATPDSSATPEPGAPENTAALENTEDTGIIPTVTPHPDSQAWFINEAGEMVCGDLDIILPMAQSDAVIYIMAEEEVLMWAADFTEELVKDMQFLPDSVRYPDDTHEVKLSFEIPEGWTPPEEGHEYMFVWLEKKPEATDAPETNATEQPEAPETPAPVQPEGIAISVLPEDYKAGAWSNGKAVFTLGGIPEEGERYAYAAIVYDERFVILSGNTFTARDEGVYDVRFAILDGIGDVAAMSDKYSLMLDYTEPAYLMVTMVGDSYTDYMVYTEDTLSGIAGYSNDGGLTWVAPGEDGSALFTGKSGDVVPAGSIMAMDNAGNIKYYDENFELPVKQSMGGGYYGGGGGGGGSGGGNTVKHSPSGEETATTSYNAVELEVSEEPMNVLVMGETELELSLALVESGEFEPDDEYLPMFNAELTVWSTFDPEAELTEAEVHADEEAQDSEDVPDTLVLTVADEPLIESAYGYMFSFNGVAVRMLYNSGIDYLVLRFGDECAALPTAGFVGGSEFTRLKAEGVSTRKFDYTLLLMGDKLAEDMPMEAVLELTVEHDGEQLVFPLTDDDTMDMYYYDVQIGSIEMMDVAYGAWEAPGTVTEGAEDDE